MRETSNVLWLMAIFFVPVGVIYTLWTDWQEMVGTVAVFFLAGMSAMAAFYMGSTRRKFDRDPGDNPRGNIGDSAGDYGFFSPGSGWPIALATGATLLFLGLAVGWWIFVMGIVVGAVALLGWSFEYFRGDIF